MNADEARAAVARAHPSMTPAAIAAHALELAGMLAKQQAVLISAAGVVEAQNRSIVAADEAFAAFHSAVRGALATINAGRVSDGRAILAVIVEAPLPQRRTPEPLSVPILPLSTFAPGPET